jgi:hypothetical protein
MNLKDELIKGLSTLVPLDEAKGMAQKMLSIGYCRINHEEIASEFLLVRDEIGRHRYWVHAQGRPILTVDEVLQLEAGIKSKKVIPLAAARQRLERQDGAERNHLRNNKDNIT